MKKRCTSKKGYFFILDSILALGVLVIGAFLIFSTYTSIPSKDEVTILSEDVMDFFASNKIEDVNNAYGGIGGILWQEGNITDADNTLLQQVGLFYDNDDLDLAEKFIANMTDNIIPLQFLFEFRVDDVLIYPKNPSQTHNNSKNSTPILIPSKKLVYGFLDEGAGTLFGPYSAEVLVWQNVI